MRLDAPSPVSFKYRVPRFRGALVERPALEARLGRAIEQNRVVVLQCPAGYGKSSALVRQLSLLPPRSAAAWIAADEGDDLPAFLSGLVSALEPFDVPWRVSDQGLTEMAIQPGGMGACAAEIAHALAATDRERGVIVIDDAQAVPDPRVFKLLGVLFDRLPAHWTIVLATRSLLPLPLARLELSGLAAQFGPADLAFSKSEAQALVVAEPNRPPIDEERLDELVEATNGWIAGLLLGLAGHKGQVPSFTARQGRYRVFQYLSEEVFAHLPEDMQRFLVRCSVLPTLTVSRCSAVAQTPAAARLLDDVAAWDAFVSLVDGEELTLRMHDLFRECLLEILHRDHPQEVPELLQRAAETEPDPVRRIELFLQAGACAAAEQALNEVAPHIAGGQHISHIIVLHKATDLFPESYRASSGWVNYWRGIACWFGMALLEMVKCMHAAAAAFRQQGFPAGAERASAYEAAACLMLSRVEESRALWTLVLEQGGDPEAIAFAEIVRGWFESSFPSDDRGVQVQVLRIRDALVRSEDPAHWFRCVGLLTAFVGRSGTREPLQQIVDRALSMAGDSHTALQGVASLLNAAIKLYAGQFESAGRELDNARETIQWLGKPKALHGVLERYLAIQAMLRGDTGATRRACTLMLEQSRPFRGKLLVSVLARTVALSALLYAGSGLWDEAVALEPELHPLASETGPLVLADISPMLGLARARIELHRGRAEAAAAVLRELMPGWRQVDSWGFSAAAHLTMALIELRCGSVELGWQALEHVMPRAGESVEIGGVLLAGADVLHELANANWGAHASGADLALIRSWADVAARLRNAPTPPPAEGSAVSDGIILSPREREVLERIARGESNKVIARGLDLSPHTVKRHVARVFDRINVSSRGEAAAWYFRRHSTSRSSGLEG